MSVKANRYKESPFFFIFGLLTSVCVLHLVLQFSEAVRVWTSSSERSHPGHSVSTGRRQDSAMREKEGEPPRPPHSFNNLTPTSCPHSLLNKLQQWDIELSCLPLSPRVLLNYLSKKATLLAPCHIISAWTSAA